MLFPTASIQNHHKFKLSVIKQPELPSQLSPLRYRPEGTPAPPLFSFPAPQAPHGSCGPASPLGHRPQTRPPPFPPDSRSPPGGPRPAAGPSSSPHKPRAEARGRKEGRGWARLEQGGQRRHAAPSASTKPRLLGAVQNPLCLSRTLF